jgi:hypothetical protein
MPHLGLEMPHLGREISALWPERRTLTRERSTLKPERRPLGRRSRCEEWETPRTTLATRMAEGLSAKLVVSLLPALEELDLLGEEALEEKLEEGGGAP